LFGFVLFAQREADTAHLRCSLRLRARGNPFDGGLSHSSLSAKPSLALSGERVTFFKTRLSLALRASESPFFACAKKGNRKKHTPVVRSPGILPCDCASRLRGSLSAHPCAHNELARIVRATLRAILRLLAAPQGAPFERHPAAEERSRAKQDQEPSRIKGRAGSRADAFRTFLDAVQGCTDSRIDGAVRGAEHRSLGGKSPKGRGDGSPRLRSSTWMYCLSNPAQARSEGAV